MKKLINVISTACVFIMLCMLMSCDKKVTIESVVHPDGSLERTVILTDVDSASVDRNMFGIHSGNGWNVSIEPLKEGQDSVKDNDYIIAFHKRFSSAEESNAELDNKSDSLFRINSTFEKKFRWFYTYLYYSDTYRMVNRFHHIKAEDYFAKEDYDFIDRLPAEGKFINKADSIYLELLNKKITENFAIQAIYEEHFNVMLDVMHQAQVEPRYIDSMYQNKKEMLQLLMKEEKSSDKDISIPQAMEQLKIDFPMDKIVPDYLKRSKDIESSLSFMHEAAFDTKYSHIIKMPWDVVESNADSISNNTLFFQPLPIKFMLNDYTMHATSRKLNYWTVVVSVLVIAITIIGFVRKRN